MIDVIILGGGWAGLSTAYHIKKQKPELDVLVLEARPYEERGGLLRSEVASGFTFDVAGPHILFSRNMETLSQIVSFLGNNVKKHERNSYILFDGRYVPYPFENGIYVLDPERRADIGSGIIQSMMKISKMSDWKPDTFRDWIYDLFGDVMAKEYLEPYNRKIWKRELTALDTDWVFSPGRLPYPELKDIVKSIAGIKSVGYKEQAGFYYPQNGGIQALYDSLLSKVASMGVRVFYSEPVFRVQRLEGSFVVNDRFETRRVLNTLPPTILADLLDSGEQLKKVAKRMDYNRVIVVGIAIDAKSPHQHAIYVPDKDIIFHRFTWMNNLAEGTPNDKSNLIAETTVPSWEPCNLDAIREKTIEDLISIGVIHDQEKITFSKVWFNEFGYPVYTKGHNKTREELFKLFGESGIFSVGRWGSWHYWNTDKVFEEVKIEVLRLTGELFYQKS